MMIQESVNDVQEQQEMLLQGARKGYKWDFLPVRGKKLGKTFGAKKIMPTFAAVSREHLQKPK